MILPGAIIGGATKAKAVVYDGTNDWLSRSSALSGVSAGSVGTISFWAKLNGGNGTNMALLQIQDTGYLGVQVARITTNAVSVTMRSTGNATRFQATTDTTITTALGWFHFLMSWNVSSSLGAIYIDDASNLATSGFAAGTIGYAGADVGVGATAAGVNKLNADMAEVWFDPTTYVDLSSSANRRKFITAGGKPAALGATGQKPTGSSPAIYLKGPASNWGTNAGSGGNFTVNGTFTDAATSPP